MRTPSFLQGVTPRPSVPANFGKVAPIEAPPLPPPSPPAVLPPPPPVGFPVALAELRPPPTPPQPAPPVSFAIEKLLLQNERLAELARSDALEIGFLVAERILEHEISQNPRAMMSLVRSAMRRLADSRELKVTVGPAAHEQLKGAEPGLVNVKLELDPSFGPGDCRVTSELGAVDGRMSTRFSELRKAVEGEARDEGRRPQADIEGEE